MMVPSWAKLDALTRRARDRLRHWRSNGRNGRNGATNETSAPWPWSHAYPPGVPVSLRYPHMAVGTLVDQAAARYGHIPAIHFDRATLTYNELKAAVDRLAAGLHRLGVSPGDRVALALPNCPEYVIGFFAVLKLGGVVVQAGPILGADELAVLGQKTSPKIVIALDLLADKLGPLGECAFVQHVVVVSLQPHLTRTEQLGYWFKRRGKHYSGDSGSMRKLRTYSEVIEEAPAYPPTAAIDPANDLAVLQPTGGTTGGLKAAMLTHANLMANACQLSAWTQLVEGQETVLAVLPLFHAYGMTSCMLAPILAKSTLVLQPRFEATAVLDAIRTHHPTIFPMVPALAAALNKHVAKAGDLEPLPPIRLCVSGGAPLSREIKTAFEAWTGARLVEGYGLSETSPVTHANPVDGRDRVGTIGVPLPDTEARIAAPDGSIDPLPPGQIGELILRGPQVMQGYLADPEQTAEVIRDGWLWTGDLATMSKDGFFTIVDRRKDLILTSGFNVYPSRVEAVLTGHDAVAECAVVGLPDTEKGEVVKAFIVRTPDTDVSPEALQTHCREHLAAYETPRFIEFVDELPRNFLGKVLKYRMRQPEATAGGGNGRSSTPPTSLPPSVSAEESPDASEQDA